MFNPPLICKEPYEHTRQLPIPGAIDDYNHFMGGVDIADQLQASFTTQQRGVKPWRPLFYWLLDSVIIITFNLSEHHRKAQLGSAKDNVQGVHQAFQEALVSELLKEPISISTNWSYITKKLSLPSIRLTRPISIHRQISRKRATCVYCRWSRATKKGRTMKVIAKSANIPKTSTICSHCNINLCLECFSHFHYYIDRDNC